eukprot:12690296-Ditylum_brightwellii.AAC.1
MQENIDCWIQFGGAERMYEAVDMGPAAVLELTLLPQGKVMPSILDIVNVGGLQPQINAIIHCVFDGHIIRPEEEVEEEEGGGEDNYGGDVTARELSLASMEAEELALLGLSPVWGLLMYGPPGCSKTALARKTS